MVLRFEIKVDDRGWKRLIKNFGPRVMNNIHQANFEFGQVVVDSFRRDFISSPRGNPASRVSAASRMKAMKRKSGLVEITIPKSAHYLDTMRPHYVGIKPGRRRLRKWVNSYFGTRKKTGLSHIYRGKRGQIEYLKKRRSVLYVTPDPFVDKAFNRVRRRHATFLRRAIQKTIKGG